MCLYWQCQSIFTCINSWGLEKYDLSQGVNWTWKFSEKYCNIIDPQLNSALVISVTDPYGNSSSLLHMCPSVLSQSVVSDSLWPHGLQPIRLLCPCGFSRQEYWSGVAMPFSRASSQIRDWTWVSCIEGRFFTMWATRKPPYVSNPLPNLPLSILSEDLHFLLYWEG